MAETEIRKDSDCTFDCDGDGVVLKVRTTVFEIPGDLLLVTEIIVDGLLICVEEIVVVKRGDKETEAEPE